MQRYYAKYLQMNMVWEFQISRKLSYYLKVFDLLFWFETARPDNGNSNYCEMRIFLFFFLFKFLKFRLFLPTQYLQRQNIRSTKWIYDVNGILYERNDATEKWRRKLSNFIIMKLTISIASAECTLYLNNKIAANYQI